MSAPLCSARASAEGRGGGRRLQQAASRTATRWGLVRVGATQSRAPQPPNAIPITALVTDERIERVGPRPAEAHTDETAATSTKARDRGRRGSSPGRRRPADDRVPVPQRLPTRALDVMEISVRRFDSRLTGKASVTDRVISPITPRPLAHAANWPGPQNLDFVGQIRPARTKVHGRYTSSLLSTVFFLYRAGLIVARTHLPRRSLSRRSSTDGQTPPMFIAVIGFGSWV